MRDLCRGDAMAGAGWLLGESSTFVFDLPKPRRVGDLNREAFFGGSGSVFRNVGVLALEDPGRSDDRICEAWTSG